MKLLKLIFDAFHSYDKCKEAKLYITANNNEILEMQL